MAELSYKLHIKDNNAEDKPIYECTCYTTTDEAIPTTGTSTGSAWELKNNNTTCYVGLWNTNSTNTPPSGCTITPLQVKKDDVVYKVLTNVLNTFDITVKGTTHQTITFSYYDASNTQHTETVTTSDKTFTALAGTAYSASISPDEGYTAGTLSATSGYVSEAMTITCTGASINAYLMTVTVPTGATITVGDNTYTEGTSTVSYDYGTEVKISAAATNSAQYSVTDLTAGGASFISGDTYTMPAGTTTVTCTATIRKYTVTLEQGTGSTLSVTANDVAVTSGTSLNYGTVLTYAATADTGYENANASATGV